MPSMLSTPLDHAMKSRPTISFIQMATPSSLWVVKGFLSLLVIQASSQDCLNDLTTSVTIHTPDPLPRPRAVAHVGCNFTVPNLADLLYYAWTFPSADKYVYSYIFSTGVGTVDPLYQGVVQGTPREDVSDGSRMWSEIEIQLDITTVDQIKCEVVHSSHNYCTDLKTFAWEEPTITITVDNEEIYNSKIDETCGEIPSGEHEIKCTARPMKSSDDASFDITINEGEEVNGTLSSEQYGLYWNGSSTVTLDVEDDTTYTCSVVDAFGSYSKSCDKDPCIPTNPCYNNGTCTADDVDRDAFTCLCTDWWAGETCTTPECPADTCGQGECIASATNTYTCECQSGFQGDHCELGVCASMPCVNGGTCTAEGDSYVCTCANGFIGNNCDESMQPSSSQAVPDWSIAIIVIIIIIVVLLLALIVYKKKKVLCPWPKTGVKDASVPLTDVEKNVTNSKHPIEESSKSALQPTTLPMDAGITPSAPLQEKPYQNVNSYQNLTGEPAGTGQYAPLRGSISSMPDVEFVPSRPSGLRLAPIEPKLPGETPREEDKKKRKKKKVPTATLR